MQFSLLTALAVALPLVSAAPFNTSEFGSTIQARGSSQIDRDNSLGVHNWYRGIKGLPYLTWDNGLMDSAQAWADHLADIDTHALEHSGPGENLWAASNPSDHDLERAALGWGAEVSNYHGETIPNGDFTSYGHYTQMVWRGTQRVGIGATQSRSGWVYVVAHYDPVGNFLGQTPY